jgi:starch synthase
MNTKKLKIAMLSAEIAPFAKAGGLGDVVGSLPKGLVKLNCDVRLLMPLYGSIDREKFKLKKIISNIEICSGGHKRKINIFKSFLPNTKIEVYFIDAPFYFKTKKIYMPGDNAERFLFFSLACLHAMPNIGFAPDIIHCHDFHTALIPDLLKTLQISYFKDTKTVFTIHNLNYQGKTDIEVLSTGGLTKDSLKSLSQDARDGDINFMVQGIINADAVTTVSPTYAKEIKTSAYGAGIEKVIGANRHKISGILNGIDTDVFNPARDKDIKQKYSASSLKKKIVNKNYLQNLSKLKTGKNKAVVGFISRLVWQKGLELITEELIRDLDAQFVFLGSGHAQYETQLKNLAKKYPGKVSVNLKFDSKLAQMIYAGADIFLMPSRFEPCGLVQLIAMRYGTIPVIRATGGLADTVKNYREKKANGFTFKDFDSGVLFNTLHKALRIYYNEPKLWRELQLNGMREDFSWDKPAKEYVKLYKKVRRKK